MDSLDKPPAPLGTYRPHACPECSSRSLIWTGLTGRNGRIVDHWWCVLGGHTFDTVTEPEGRP